MTKTIKDLRLSAALAILEEFQAQLRAKVKYDEPTTTWEAVREMYYEVRNEYAHLDLLDYDEPDGTL